jgi:transposase
MAQSSSSVLYSTDLSESEWRLLKPLLPCPSHTGRPRRWKLRLIVNAIFYQLKSGCPWRLLPREYPPWQTVYSCFRKWRDDGTWEQIHTRLREKLRRALARKAQPTGAIIDSQSVKTNEKGAVVAMTDSRGSKDVNAICWSTPKVSF